MSFPFLSVNREDSFPLSLTLFGLEGPLSAASRNPWEVKGQKHRATLVPQTEISYTTPHYDPKYVFFAAFLHLIKDPNELLEPAWGVPGLGRDSPSRRCP